MGNYIVEVSFTGRCYISVDAENKEDAQEMVLEAINLNMGSDNKDIEVDQWEWGYVIEEKSGNVQEAYKSSIDVYEN